MNKTENQLPEVSIALCTYNGELFLHEQIESILNQDYANISEIICVDDNSTDGTWKILQEYAGKYSNFKIFRNSSNQGFIRNFEKALTLTSKKFIAIADQDDIWYPNKISKLVRVIGENLMAYSDNEYIGSDGITLGKKFSDFRRLSTCTSCLNFVLYNGISGHTMLINRDLLKYALPFPDEIPFDYWLAFHAIQYGVIPYINEPLVSYRQHDNNTLGAIGIKKNVKDIINGRKVNYNRIIKFSMAINENLQYEKQVLLKLAYSYIDFSFKTRLKRVVLFWKNRDSLLFFKKRNEIRKAYYCIKMFWHIR